MKKRIMFVALLSFALLFLMPTQTLAEGTGEGEGNEDISIPDLQESSEESSTEEESSIDTQLEGEGYFGQVTDWVNDVTDNLGFLKQTVEMFQGLVNVLKNSDAKDTFTVPKIEIMGYTLIEQTEAKIIHKEMQSFLKVVRIVMDSVCVIFALNMATDYYHKFFGGEN